MQTVLSYLGLFEALKNYLEICKTLSNKREVKIVLFFYQQTLRSNVIKPKQLYLFLNVYAMTHPVMPESSKKIAELPKKS